MARQVSQAAGALDLHLHVSERFRYTSELALTYRFEREGGGACADYPGGTLPDPCYILPVEVAYDIVHVEHSAFLVTQPLLEVNAVGFPDAL